MVPNHPNLLKFLIHLRAWVSKVDGLENKIIRSNTNDFLI